MKSLRTIISAGFLASALALAGCGGGGNDANEPPADDTATGPTPEDMSLRDALDAAGDAKAAYEMAMQLHEDATDASEAVSAKGANGSSQTAYDNVMTVLNARAAIMAQHGIATQAVADAEDIDTSGLSPSDVTRIMGLVDDAKDSLAGIDKILNDAVSVSDSLAMAEEVVKTGSPVSASRAEIAQSKAENVAKTIAAAIDATAATAFASDTHVGKDDAPEGAIKPAGVYGKTFADIAGSVSISVKGKASEDFDSAADGTGFDFSSDVTAGTAAASAWYMGIPGRLVCVTGTCGEDDDKLTGEWFFTATDATARYSRENYGDDYFEVTNAASYGYWLDDAGMIHLHAATMTATDTLDWERPATASEAVKATYEGAAGGYSHRTVGKGDDAKNYSGEFTANVMLTATFNESGTAPGLAGNINGFDGGGGMHVNTGWKVRLGNATQDSSQNNFFAGNVTDGEEFGDEWATAGRWSAAAYGPTATPQKRAAGFVGAFDADFSDGEAMGVYHVEAD